MKILNNERVNENRESKKLYKIICTEKRDFISLQYSTSTGNISSSEECRDREKRLNVKDNKKCVIKASNTALLFP